MTDSTPENLPQASAEAADASVPAMAAATTELSPRESPLPSGIEAELADLPTFARRLLRIRVPIQVTLASQRKSVQEIVELGPGSIVKFDKTCDESLELCIGDRTVAQGEVVKVGDKFGLRISNLVT
jgi:flagellar motor switch protein FliN